MSSDQQIFTKVISAKRDEDGVEVKYALHTSEELTPAMQEVSNKYIGGIKEQRRNYVSDISKCIENCSDIGELQEKLRIVSDSNIDVYQLFRLHPLDKTSETTTQLDAHYYFKKAKYDISEEQKREAFGRTLFIDNIIFSASYLFVLELSNPILIKDEELEQYLSCFIPQLSRSVFGAFTFFNHNIHARYTSSTASELIKGAPKEHAELGRKCKEYFLTTNPLLAVYCTLEYGRSYGGLIEFTL